MIEFSILDFGFSIEGGGERGSCAVAASVSEWESAEKQTSVVILSAAKNPRTHVPRKRGCPSLSLRSVTSLRLE
jgi:hypothetical protein